MAAWLQKRDDASLSAWGRLAERESRNLRTLTLAARAFGDRYRFSKAGEIIQKMRELDPSSSLVHQRIGDVWRAVGQPIEAMASYEKALSCSAPSDALLLELAHQYERSRRDEEALALLKKAAGDPRATLIKAKIARRSGDASKAIDDLQSLTENLPQNAEIRLEALGELTLLHDSEGNYDKAFQLATAGKEVHLGRSAAEQAASSHSIERFAQMVDTLQPEDFERWAREFPPPTGEPSPALLTGFPRSGTTLMEQVLDAHPKVVSLEERDLMAREVLPAMHGKLTAAVPFMEILNQISPDQIQEQRKFIWEAFKSMGGRPLDGLVHVDKNPAYNLLIPFYLRIFPETRLLIALRDPRDVLLSCYLRYLPLNPMSVTFLTLASTAHRYALDMTAWLKFSVMIPDQWAEIRYEDMVGNLEPEARRICETLGVDWDRDMLNYREKLSGKRVNSPTYTDVTKPIYSSSIGRWRNYQKHLEPYFAPLEPFLEAFDY